MSGKDIETQKPYTLEELADIGIISLGIVEAGYQLFKRGKNERYMLDITPKGFVLRAWDHKYTVKE